MAQPLKKKEWNFAICHNIDGLGGHYAKCNTSDDGKYCVRSLIHEIKKGQPSSDYNKNEADTQI